MNKRGLTLIELLIVLVISSILIAGIYRTFIHQQHTYTVQEQVVDMQQNVRMGINQMVREIRMAGFGRQNRELLETGEGENDKNKKLGWGVSGMHGRFKSIVWPSDDGQSITVVAAYEQVTFLTANAPFGTNILQLNDATQFDKGGQKYISINGTESWRIKDIVGNQIELDGNLLENHFQNEPVFRVIAITYSLGNFEGKTSLLRSNNLPDPDTAVPQPLAENIEFLQFTYTLNDGSVFVGIVPGGPQKIRDIRMVQVTIRARTDRADPELGGGGDGFRRRTLTSNIQLRNLSSL